ncbi:hypothetical protein V6N13_018410 [Hibiscus sabdariffa]
MNSDNPVPSALTGALNNAARSSFACIDGRGMQCCMGGSIGVGGICMGSALHACCTGGRWVHWANFKGWDIWGELDMTEDVSYDDDDAEEDPDAAQRPQRARRAPRSYLSTTPRHGQKLRNK